MSTVPQTIDFNVGRCDMLVLDEEIERRKADWIPMVPADATPWQRIYRQTVTQLSDGAVIEGAADSARLPRRCPGTITDVKEAEGAPSKRAVHGRCGGRCEGGGKGCGGNGH
jgi:hypothetical protein